MNPRFVNFGPVKVAGYFHRTSMSNNTCPNFWQEIMADGRHEDLHKQDWLKQHREFAVCFDGDGDAFSYVIGVEVKEGAIIPEEFHVCDLPQGEYAVFSTPPSSGEEFPEKIGIAWKAAYDWLQTSEIYNPVKGGVDFELYNCDCKDGEMCEPCKSGLMVCDVYIAVTKK